MSNLDLYEKVRQVPQEAQKTISGGRLKGMTDINPMWRIKTLTEHFGICGVGWKVVPKRFWIEEGANNEKTAFSEIELFVKDGDKWSDAIPGIGGSMLTSKESNGLYTSDECYKMAFTDAISVACKMLGFGADVYWIADKTKYDKTPNNNAKNENTPSKLEKPLSKYQKLMACVNASSKTLTDVNEWIKNKTGKVINVNALADDIYTELYDYFDKLALEQNPPNFDDNDLPF